MTTPVLLPPTSAELAVPYITPGGFAAYPNWLDLDNLIPGGVASLQVNELADVLLTASRWCCSVCEDMRLDAHWVQGEQTRTRSSSGGRFYIRPRDIPIRSITSLSYGWDPAAMTALSLPVTSMWVEDGREVSFRAGGAGPVFTGPALQFGGGPLPGQTTFVNWSYVAGYPSTTLSAACNANAMSVTVTDPTGILPGDVLRLYDEGETAAGANEAVTVAAAYAPALPAIPPAATSIPLAGTGTQYAHFAATGITGMPRDIIQATIVYAVALLMREDVGAEAPAAMSAFTASARTTDGGRGGQAAGLINDAYQWLARYAPVMRS